MTYEIQTKLIVTDKTFKNAEGQDINYKEVVATVAGEKIHLSVKSSDKRMFDYLLTHSK